MVTLFETVLTLSLVDGWSSTFCKTTSSWLLHVGLIWSVKNIDAQNFLRDGPTYRIQGVKGLACWGSNVKAGFTQS